MAQTLKRQVATQNKTAAVDELREELARKFSEHLPAAGEKKTAIPALSLHRRTAPMACIPTTYEPSLAIFVQGRKRVNMGGVTYLCNESSFLLTSVDVPVVSQIFASEEVPYMAIRLGLDMQMVREIISREELPEPAAASQARGIAVGKLTPELLSACSRLLDLLHTPEDIPFLSNTIQREIVYRLLRGPKGERLRATQLQAIKATERPRQSHGSGPTLTSHCV